MLSLTLCIHYILICLKCQYIFLEFVYFFEICYNYLGDNMQRKPNPNEAIEIEKKSYTKELEQRLETTKMED